jgi:alkylhydroperoxidase family enzyme
MTARVTLIRRASDFPGNRAEAEKLFGILPGGTIDASHDGLAIAAHNPVLALKLAQLSGFIAGDLPWCQRTDLRELAIQTLNLHFKSDYGLRTRTAYAEAAGVSAAMVAALPDHEASALFNAEQSLVISYARAVASNAVPDALFARMVEQFGEAQTVECTTLIAFWSFWALLLNATRPD